MTSLERPELATTPYIVRNEFFGCLLYQRQSGKYFSLDKDMLALLRASQTKTLDAVFNDVYGERAAKVSRSEKDYEADYKQLLAFFESSGIMRDGRFVGAFLENSVPHGLKALVAPLEVNLQLTSNCPNACAYCWVKRLQGKLPGEDMRTSEIKRLLDDLAAMGTFVLNLGGGCAVSRSDFADVATYADKLGMKVNLSVEGASLDKKRVDLLASLNINSYKIGVAAGTDKIWSSMREGGESSQRGFQSKIKYLFAKLKEVNSPAKVAFKAVVVDKNCDDLSNLVNKLNSLTREWGIREATLYLDPALPIGLTSNSDSRCFLNPKRVMAFVNWVKDYNRRATSGDSIRVKTNACVPVMESKRDLEGFGCHCGYHSCFISAKGYVYPSAALAGVIEASNSINLRQDRMINIWQQSQLFRNFRGQSANETCKECEYYRSCHGGCRSRAMLYNPKSWRAIDPWCSIVYEKANSARSKK